MKRDKLKEIIKVAASQAECSEADTQRLVAAADDIDRIAIGTFRITEPGFECGCPAMVAGYWQARADDWVEGTPIEVQAFPNLFDVHFSRTGKGTFKTTRVSTQFTTRGNEYVTVED